MIKTLLEIRPAVLAMEMRIPPVKARALRLGMLDTIQALLMGLVG